MPVEFVHGDLAVPGDRAILEQHDGLDAEETDARAGAGQRRDRGEEALRVGGGHRGCFGRSDPKIKLVVAARFPGCVDSPRLTVVGGPRESARMRALLPLLGVSVVACSGDESSLRRSSGPVRVADGLHAEPLPERGAAEGPRFVRVPETASGLQFVNELRPPHVVPYLYAGAGLAVGDYDGDGWLDVYCVGQDGPNRLFRQVAPLRFEDVTAAAGGVDGGDAWGTAAAFADVDGDRDLDLFVCNTESPNLLYVNAGDGTFRERAAAFGLATVAASTGAAFADYDNDGDLDLHLLTNRVFGALLLPEIVAGVELPGAVRKTRSELHPPYPRFAVTDDVATIQPGYEDFFFAMGAKTFVAGQRDRLFRNDGPGLFTDVTEAAGIAGHDNGLSATFWDKDDDGDLDLYVANDLESPDRLYENRGEGRFVEVTRAALPHTAYFGMGSDFGDLDNDGRLDFVVADMSATTHAMGKLLMGNMDENRWFLMNARPQQNMRNAVFLNTGTPRFMEVAQLTNLASSDWTWSVRLADLDEDGRLDFFATNGIPLFEDHPDHVAEFRALWRSGRRDAALALARQARRVDERNVVRRNLGDLAFEDAGAEFGLDEAGVGQGAVVVDLDRDGDVDVLVNNQNRPLSLFENRTHGTHRIAVQLVGTASNTHGVGARLTLQAAGLLQTRLVALARGYMSSSDAGEVFGLGAAMQIDELIVRWPSGREQRFAGLAVDRRYVIHEPAAPTASPVAPAAAPLFVERVMPPHAHVERPFDDFAVQALLPQRLSQLGPGLAFGDVDGDGRDELWRGGAAGQSGVLLKLEDAGGATPIAGPWHEDAACEDLGAVFLDFDDDGDLDLYVASGGVEAMGEPRLLRDRLYVNEGPRGFARAPAEALPPLEIADGHVAAADFDRDGDLDLFVGGRCVPGRWPESPRSVLLLDEGRHFRDATAELAPELAAVGMVGAASWCDVDADGFVDLVVAAQWQPVRVFRNRAGKSLQRDDDTGALATAAGLWNGLAAADLDGDGDQDLVATNLGLNTKYRADATHTLHVFADDFDGDGELDIVESKEHKERLFPVRGLSCSSQAMPFIGERFPTFEGFAHATLPEIYGVDALASALKLSANELRSVVFENDGARFRLHPLPRFAQASPGFGIGIADFDLDGTLDLVLAQNSFAPEPETGGFGGGVGAVLRGRGGLRFDALPPDRAGVVIEQAGTALVVGELDGDGVPDFVCATNDGPLRRFDTWAHAPGLAVRLAGPPGNPAAIGARLTLHDATGSAQTRGLVAGAGHLSQAAPLAFFRAAGEGARLVVEWPDGVRTEVTLPRTHGLVHVSR